MIVVFWWGWPSISIVPKIATLQCLYNIAKKFKDEVDLLHADKHQSFLKVCFNTLGIKVSYKIDISIISEHDQAFSNTQSKKFAIFWQYLKNEVRNGGHFWHADKRRSFYKLVSSFLMEVARHVQSTQKRKLVVFLQCIKNCCNCFVFIVMQNI